MLRVQEVRKQFGGLIALQTFSVDFLPGEIHAVVGENGAGKSTLMNVLGGFLIPEQGTVSLNDKQISIGNPQKVRREGIEMVHQHFMLVPELTVFENLQLSALGIGKSLTHSEAEALARRFNWSIPWQSKIREIAVGLQQKTEILKTLLGDPEVFIFDEPTAVLSEAEIEEFFTFLRQLKAQRKIVLIIAHKIQEVLSISDRITVLRKGEHITTVPQKDAEPDQLIQWMVGDFVSLERNVSRNPREEKFSAKGLTVRSDRGEIAVEGLDLEVSKGLILGIGGVDGNGQLELSEALAGVRPLEAGSIEGADKIGFVPQDRRVDGLATEMSIAENMVIEKINDQPAKLNWGPLRKHARTLIDRFLVKAESELDVVKGLSGGNQQKVILARVLDANPDTIIAVNPTRGLDVKATSFIHDQLSIAAQNGAAVVLISTNRDELSQLSDSTLYLSRGKLYASEAEALR